MKKRLLGAILSGIFFVVYFSILLSFIIYTQFISTDKMPFIIFIIILLACLIPLIGIIYVLFSRVREIQRGEEEEAKKY